MDSMKQPSPLLAPLLLLAVAFLLPLTPATAAPPVKGDPSQYGPGKGYPFTAEQDRDGAMFVWFITCYTGLRYDYIPASEFPHTPRFRKVKKPRDGDVAWWPDMVALYQSEGDQYLMATGTRKPGEGMPEPQYYRLRLAKGEKFAPAPTPYERIARCMPR